MPKLDEFPYFGDNVEITSKITKEWMVAGCPKPDCIPSIDNPKWISNEEANVMYDSGTSMFTMLIIENGKVSEVYAAPEKIMDFHEIINFKTQSGIPVALTYCPLCQTVENYVRILDGDELELGVSGLLMNSALIIFDRNSNSLFSQVWGEGIVGKYTGKKLQQLPCIQTTLEELLKEYPNAKVLSTDTGDEKRMKMYDRGAYGDYKTSDTLQKRFLHEHTHIDNYYHPKEIVFLIEIDGESWIIPRNHIKEDVYQHNKKFYSKTLAGGRVFFEGSIEDEFNWDKWIPSGISFYFAARAYYPDSSILSP